MKHPILKPNRVADLTALVRFLAACPQEQKDSELLDRTIPNLTAPTKAIVTEHPDIFRVGGTKTVAVSLLFRFMIPGRPPLTDEQTNAILHSVNVSHDQALQQSRHNLEWWKWVTSFATGGVVWELIRRYVLP